MSTKKKMLQAAAGVGGAPEGAWDLSYAYHDDPPNFSRVTTQGGISVSAQETAPSEVFFKPDGTKMYVLGDTGNGVDTYNLSTPWETTSASASSFQGLTAGNEVTPQGLYISPDGFNLYTCGFTQVAVQRFLLSTAWDPTTASFSQSLSLSGQSALFPTGVEFKPDGTRMYVVDYNLDEILEYSLSTAWDISTASYVQSFSVAAQNTLAQSIRFSADGNRLYMSARTENVYSYTLSTPWDISTMSFSETFNTNTVATTTNPYGLFVNETLSSLFITSPTTDTVVRFNIFGGFSVSAEEATALGLSFSSDGTKMYVLGQAGLDVNQYSLSTAWDTSTASYVQAFSIASQETSPTAVTFKPDGTKMYIIGSAGDDINEYSLSTAWDISTASYVRVSASLTGKETIPNTIFFKPDGTKLYMSGQGSDKVHEYNLSTAWDVSTLSFLQTSTVTISNPCGLFFDPDGTKMYLSNSSDIAEYNLNTPWDVSTASYVLAFPYPLTQQREVFFHPKGTKLFAVNNTERKVFTFSLGVQP